MSIKNNVFYNTILNISNVLFPFITVPYVSRILGVENIGVVNFATAYASYFALFAGLGIPMYGIREIAKNNNNREARSKIFSELLRINCITTLICCTVYLVSIFMIPALNKERVFLLIAGISLLFSAVNVDWFFTGRENMRIITIRSLIVRLITFAGLFIFVRTREHSLIYLILTLAATVCGQLWNFGYLLKKEIKIIFFDLDVKRHLKPIFVLFVANIAVSIYTLLDTLMLGFMSNYIEVGYYASAIKVTKLILPVVTAMTTVVIVRINMLRSSKQEDKIQELLERSFNFMFTLAAPIAIGLTIISPRFVPFFFGQEFVPVVVLIQILSLLIPIIGLSNFGAQILLGWGKDKRFMITELIGAFSNFILNIMLIPLFGAIGACISSVIAESLITIITIAFATKIISVKIKIKNIMQPLLASLLIIPVSILISHLINNNWIYLLLTISVSILLYFSTMSLILKNEQINYTLNIVLNKLKNR